MPTQDPDRPHVTWYGDENTGGATVTPNCRIDWPFILVWAALGLLTCMVANLLLWLLQRVLLAVGWDGVLLVVALIGVAGVAMIAKKDNPTW